MIEDDPDALFRRDDIERMRVNKTPELKRVVVAVDPPASFNAKSNACGIVVAGLGEDGHAYVLADLSLERARPVQWAQKVVAAYHKFEASRVVAEVNQGGAMVEQVLREVEPSALLPRGTCQGGQAPAGRTGGGACTSRAACITPEAFRRWKMKCAVSSKMAAAPTGWMRWSGR